jgi:tRNA-dihydrouridine synthase B
MMRAGAIGSGLQIGGVNLGQGLILAPMAGITDLSFRLIARRFGADLVTSEMVSAEGVLRRNRSTRSLLRTRPEEKPLAVQLFGGEPHAVSEAARIIADQGVDIIDLNMGCAVPKVIRQGAGAALLLDPARAARMVAAVRQAVIVPLTVKIRSGWSREEINAVEVARCAEDAGANAVTVHPRTARQGFSGAADWDVITRVRATVSIPVIGNGDIRRSEQVERMQQRTGCDGVMLEHLRLSQECPPGRPSLAGARSLIIWYSRGFPGSNRFRAALAGCGTSAGMLEISRNFFVSLSETWPAAEGEDIHEG